MIEIVRLPSFYLLGSGRDETYGRVGSGSEEFEDLFNECLEEALTDLIGRKGCETLLDYFERQGRVAKDDILAHPEELTMLLNKAFGTGGLTVERCVVTRLYSALNWDYKPASQFDFKAQLEEVRRRWETSRAV
jgi:hypothetical protein